VIYLIFFFLTHQFSLLLTLLHFSVKVFLLMNPVDKFIALNGIDHSRASINNILKFALNLVRPLCIPLSTIQGRFA
jgi:hypothetical protein